MSFEKIRPSQTFLFASKAQALMAEGKDIIRFDIGEPDFSAPIPMKTAAIKAIQDNFSGYTNHSGIPELRELICEKFKKDNNIDYDPSQVIISVGAKFPLYNFFQMCREYFGSGFKAALIKPHWPSYKDQVLLAGGNPVFLDMDDKFRFSADTLKKKIKEHAGEIKVLLINTPNNPTGAVLPKSELQKIADLAVKHDLFVVSDEIYEKIIYGNKKHVSIASLNDEIKERTFTINGFSKTHSIPGWRLGYIAGPKRFIDYMAKVQSQSVTHPSSIIQKAVLDSMKHHNDEIEREIKENVKEFERRRNALVKSINENILWLSCSKPDGAFYVFAKIDFDKMPCNNSQDLSMLLMEKALVSTTPGSAFGMEGYLRISYVTSLERISEGINRLKNLF